MPVDESYEEPDQLILDNFGGAAAYPAPDRWDDVDDVDYLYRENTILVRSRTRTASPTRMAGIFDEVGYGDVPEGDARQIRREGSAPRGNRPPHAAGHRDAGTGLLDRLDQDLGREAATPDHMLYVCPYPCPATEPTEVPPGTVDPVPPPGLEARGRRPCRGVHRPECDGDGVFVSIVDTGLIKDAAAGHPWLAGVQGAVENPYTVDSDGDDRSLRTPGTARSSPGPAQHGPEGIGLRRAGIRHRGRRLRDEARRQPGGRPRPGPGHPGVHLHHSDPPRSVPGSPSTTSSNGASAT